MERERDVENPYLPPQSRLAMESNPPSRIELAGRAQRLGAVLADNIMFAVLILPGYILLDGVGVSSEVESVLRVVAPAGGLLALALLGYNLWLLHLRGQTLGKTWLGVRIVRSDGGRCGLGRIFWLRYFVPGLIGAIPCLGSLFSVVDALMIFAEDRRCAHDHIADTIVVRA